MSCSSFSSPANHCVFPEPGLLGFLQPSHHSTLSDRWVGTQPKLMGSLRFWAIGWPSYFVTKTKKQIFLFLKIASEFLPGCSFPPTFPLMALWLCCSPLNITRLVVSRARAHIRGSEAVCSRSLGLKYLGTGTKKFHPSLNSADIGSVQHGLNLPTEWLVHLPPDSKAVADGGMNSFLHVLSLGN